MSIQSSVNKPQDERSKTLKPWRLIRLDILQNKPNGSKRLKMMGKDKYLKAKDELQKPNHENNDNNLEAGWLPSHVPDEFTPLKFAHQIKGTKRIE